MKQTAEELEESKTDVKDYKVERTDSRTEEPEHVPSDSQPSDHKQQVRSEHSGSDSDSRRGRSQSSTSRSGRSGRRTPKDESLQNLPRRNSGARGKRKSFKAGSKNSRARARSRWKKAGATLKAIHNFKRKLSGDSTKTPPRHNHPGLTPRRRSLFHHSEADSWDHRSVTQEMAEMQQVLERQQQQEKKRIADAKRSEAAAMEAELRRQQIIQEERRRAVLENQPTVLHDSSDSDSSDGEEDVAENADSNADGEKAAMLDLMRQMQASQQRSPMDEALSSIPEPHRGNPSTPLGHSDPSTLDGRWERLDNGKSWFVLHLTTEGSHVTMVATIPENDDHAGHYEGHATISENEGSRRIDGSIYMKGVDGELIKHKPLPGRRQYVAEGGTISKDNNTITWDNDVLWERIPEPIEVVDVGRHSDGRGDISVIQEVPPDLHFAVDEILHETPMPMHVIDEQFSDDRIDDETGSLMTEQSSAGYSQDALSLPEQDTFERITMVATPERVAAYVSGVESSKLGLNALDLLDESPEGTLSRKGSDLMPCKCKELTARCEQLQAECGSLKEASETSKLQHADELVKARAELKRTQLEVTVFDDLAELDGEVPWDRVARIIKQESLSSGHAKLLGKACQTYHSMEEKARRFREQSSEAEMQLKRQKWELEQAQVKLSRSESDNERVVQENERLSSDLASLRAQSEVLQSRHRASQDKTRDLEGTLKRSKDEADYAQQRLKLQLTDLQRSLESATSDRQRVEEARRSLEEANRQLESEVRKIRNSSEMENAQTTALHRTESTATAVMADSFAKQMEAMREQNERDMQAQRKTLEGNLELRLQTQAQQLSSQHELELKKLQLEMQAMKKQHEDALGTATKSSQFQEQLLKQQHESAITSLRQKKADEASAAEQQRRRLEQHHQDVAASLKQKHDDELTGAQQKHERTLEQHQETITSLKQKYEDRLATAKRQQESLTQQHQERLVRATQKLNEEIARASKRDAQLTQQHSEAVSLLKHRHEYEITGATQQQQRLVQQHEDALASVELRHDQRQRELKQQHSDALAAARRELEETTARASRAKEQHSDAMSSIRQKHVNVTETTEQQHQQIEQRHQQELASMRNKYELEVQQLRGSHKADQQVSNNNHRSNIHQLRISQENAAADQQQRLKDQLEQKHAEAQEKLVIEHNAECSRLKEELAEARKQIEENQSKSTTQVNNIILGGESDYSKHIRSSGSPRIESMPMDIDMGGPETSSKSSQGSSQKSDRCRGTCSEAISLRDDNEVLRTQLDLKKAEQDKASRDIIRLKQLVAIQNEQQHTDAVEEYIHMTVMLVKSKYPNLGSSATQQLIALAKQVPLDSVHERVESFCLKWLSENNISRTSTPTPGSPQRKGSNFSLSKLSF